MPGTRISKSVAIDRLRDAINSGDPARVADCFTDDYRAEVPHHPDQSFVGSERVLTNWTAIFNTTPHLTAEVLRTAVSGAEIWAEWKMSGVTTAGDSVTFAGPAVVTIRGDRINWSRFYLDRVDD